MNVRRSGLTTLAALDATVLVTLGPDWHALGAQLAAPHRWLDAVGADTAAAELASAALWLAAAWLALGLIAMSAAALPGAAGRAARHLARFVLPRAVYRLAAGAAGMGVLLAPVAAGAASPGSHHTASPIPTRAAPAPAWPSDDPIPAPSWPTTTPAAAPAAAPTTAPTTAPTGPPAAPPAPVANPSAPHRGPQPSRPGSVLVRPGDSLWTIAASHERAPSTARTAVAWPRWFAANRHVIGSDPDHIVPGQVLHAPTKEELP